MLRNEAMEQNAASGADAGAERIRPALAAFLLGVFILLGAGLAPIAAIHNAAHDARHSFAFPCH
jgi:cobalt transporter subunit CbtB